MYLRLKPYDYALFRDGKPFSAGSEHYATSIFPPFGATVYHALRTALLENNGTDFNDKSAFTEEKISAAIGGEVRLRGIWLDDGRVWLPTPADLRRRKRDGKWHYELLPLVKVPAGALGTGFGSMTVQRDLELESVAGCWLRQDNWAKYLNGGLDFAADEVVSRSAIISREERIGVGLNGETRTAAEGKLYLVDGVALKPGWHLGLELTAPEGLREVKWLTLGGERRVFTCAAAEGKLQLPSAAETAALIARTGMFKMILLTPALFANGWLPGWLDEKTRTGERGGVKVELLAVLSGRPLKWGGFDLAKNRQKPIRNLVAPGSVYYFRIPDCMPEKAQKVAEALHLKNVTDEGEHYGFGLTAIGGTKYD